MGALLGPPELGCKGKGQRGETGENEKKTPFDDGWRAKLTHLKVKLPASTPKRNGASKS